MGNTPSDEELNSVLCHHWPAFSMQAVLVQMWLRDAMRAALAKWGAQQPVVREPLTDGQAKEVLWTEHLRWMEAAGLDTEGMRTTAEWLDHWLAYVRAIERAHGITKERL